MKISLWFKPSNSVGLAQFTMSSTGETISIDDEDYIVFQSNNGFKKAYKESDINDVEVTEVTLVTE